MRKVVVLAPKKRFTGCACSDADHSTLSTWTRVSGTEMWVPSATWSIVGNDLQKKKTFGGRDASSGVESIASARFRFRRRGECLGFIAQSMEELLLLQERG